MSCKHNRWDRRWLISSVQLEWQNIAQMIESRGRAGESKFVFSVLHTWQRARQKTLLFHTPKLHIVPPFGVITVLSNTNHWNHLPSLLSGCVWQSIVTYHRFCDREDWKKMQITYHTPHTSLKLFLFFFPPLSQLVITDWLVFLVISFGGK